MRYFLEGVVTTADEALATTRRILALFDSDRQKIEGLGRAAASIFRAHEYLQKKPITGIREMAEALGLTYPTVASALDRMTGLGIVRELTGYARNRVFAYSLYVGLLSEGTEPLA